MMIKSNQCTYFDLLIVGSGISCTALLLRLIEKLLNTGQSTQALSIAVVEKEEELWKGIPYGKRSSCNALTITTLGEFVPPSEKDSFMSWLKGTLDVWIADVEENAGSTGKHWLKNNSSLMEGGRWDDIYLPRYLFGDYLNEKILAAIDAATRNGLVTISKLQGEAIDLSRSDNFFEITIEDKRGRVSSATAETVVLAIGSPPAKSLQPPSGTRAYEYINDTYSPSLESNLKRIESVLSGIRQQHKRNILMVGSNASALELIYLIETTPCIRTLLNNLVVLSYSGKLPARIGTANGASHTFDKILSLKSRTHFDATELIRTFEEDVGIAESRGVNIGNVYEQLNDLVVELMKRMEEKEQKFFYGHYGQRFAKLVRRAGADYRDAADSLERDGKLKFIKGSFRRLEPPAIEGDGARVVYLSDGGSDEISCSQTFPLVINCGGSEELHHSSSRLINALVSNGLFAINDTKKGVEVSENFEAAKGLYVIGPLLGGIFNNRVRLWHLENAKSIFRMGDLLADEMLQQLL